MTADIYVLILVQVRHYCRLGLEASDIEHMAVTAEKYPLAPGHVGL